MHEIGEMIRNLIDEGLSPIGPQQGLGLCPRCRAEVVEGVYQGRAARQTFGVMRAAPQVQAILIGAAL